MISDKALVVSILFGLQAAWKQQMRTYHPDKKSVLLGRVLKFALTV